MHLLEAGRRPLGNLGFRSSSGQVSRRRQAERGAAPAAGLAFPMPRLGEMGELGLLAVDGGILGRAYLVVEAFRPIEADDERDPVLVEEPDSLVVEEDRAR